MKKPSPIRRLIEDYLKPYWVLLLLAMIGNIIVAASTGLTPWFIQKAIDEVFTQKDEAMLVILPLALAAVAFLRGIAGYGSNVALNYVSQNIIALLQKQVFIRIVRSNLAHLTQKHSGEYISLFMTDIVRLREILTATIIGLLRHGFTVIALIIFVFTINYELASIYVAIVVPLGFIFMARLSRITRKASRKGLEETGSLSAMISETLNGLRIVKAYGREDSQIKYAYKTISQVLNHVMRVIKARAATSPLVETLAGLAVAVIVYYGGRQNIEGSLTAGQFMGFITALLLIYQPLRALAGFQTALQEGIAAATRVFEVLDIPQEINKPFGRSTKNP